MRMESDKEMEINSKEVKVMKEINSKEVKVMEEMNLKEMKLVMMQNCEESYETQVAMIEKGYGLENEDQNQVIVEVEQYEKDLLPHYHAPHNQKCCPDHTFVCI